MYSAIAANKRNTIVILIVFLVLLGGLGWLIALFMGDGSWTITIMTIIGAGLYAWFQFYNAASIAVMTSGAVQIEQKDNPRL